MAGQRKKRSILALRSPWPWQGIVVHSIHKSPFLDLKLHHVMLAYLCVCGPAPLLCMPMGVKFLHETAMQGNLRPYSAALFFLLLGHFFNDAFSLQLFQLSKLCLKPLKWNRDVP